ncbi:MAG: metallophosphoesterase [Pseudomonadales bacterium]|nr:metallophosphoesterase [Pseudomonadales bacterium]
MSDGWLIAHVSDPHLTRPTPASVRRLGLKRLLSYLSWRRKRRFRHLRPVLDAVVADLLASAPRHLLVTGDLTHVGLPGECREARDWLAALAGRVPVSVVPGNHDRLVNDDWAATVGQWAPWLGGATTPGAAPAGNGAAGFPVVTRCGAVALIGLDSAVPTAPLLAGGQIGGEQLDRLAGHLAALGREGLFRLVYLHHSPLPHGHAWRKRLRDAAALLAVLRAQGAELVVHGHGHHEAQETVATRAGPMLVVGAPSASLVGAGRAGWNGYAITREADGWAVTVVRHRLGPDGMQALPCTVQRLVRDRSA